jgi:DNA-binding transcriptional MerR regulator
MCQLLLYYSTVSEGQRYGIQELASLGGVSRRTVRYYVQEDLLPESLGLGRGEHYTQEHLDALIRIRTLQEQGLTIAQIREALAGPEAALPPIQVPLRQAWVRLVLAPGVELHVSTDKHLPSPARLSELAEWCRDNLLSKGACTEVLLLQQADGAWQLTDQLLALISVAGRSEGLARSLGVSPANQRATQTLAIWLVLQWLDRTGGCEGEVWRPAMAKAGLWLEQNGAPAPRGHTWEDLAARAITRRA